MHARARRRYMGTVDAGAVNLAAGSGVHVTALPGHASTPIMALLAAVELAAMDSAAARTLFGLVVLLDHLAEQLAVFFLVTVLDLAAVCALLDMATVLACRLVVILLRRSRCLCFALLLCPAAIRAFYRAASLVFLNVPAALGRRHCIILLGGRRVRIAFIGLAGRRLVAEEAAFSVMLANMAATLALVALVLDEGLRQMMFLDVAAALIALAPVVIVLRRWKLVL